MAVYNKGYGQNPNFGSVIDTKEKETIEESKKLGYKNWFQHH